MELISYALDYVSFLIQNLKDTSRIKSIILFGSAVRGEAGKESDIDLFVDIIGEQKELEKEIFRIRDKFFDSVKFKKYWELLNIRNEINIIVGRIDEWKLKDSMLGNSIVLYEKFSPHLEQGKNKAILSWNSIKNNSIRVMLNKKIFGYKYYKRYYEGLLEKYQGIKSGTNSIIIPVEHLNIFLKLFRKFRVAVKIKRVFEYQE